MYQVLETPRSDNHHWLFSASTPSLLLCLPVEIRLLIYTYVIGNETLHISCHYAEKLERNSSSKLGPLVRLHKTRERSELYHCLCISENLTRAERESFGCCKIEDATHGIAISERGHIHYEVPDPWFPHYQCIRGDNLARLNLALLKTCRQIYEEAWPVLYHTNTFSFHGPRAFANFCGISLEGYVSGARTSGVKDQRIAKKAGPFAFGSTIFSPLRKVQASSFCREIRSLQIHAGCKGSEDTVSWDKVCAEAAPLFSSLQKFNLIIDLAPSGQINSPKWTKDCHPDSGFRAFKTSPLKAVTINVIDPTWRLNLPQNCFYPSEAAFRSTAWEKEQVAQMIMDDLLQQSTSKNAGASRASLA